MSAPKRKRDEQDVIATSSSTTKGDSPTSDDVEIGPDGKAVPKKNRSAAKHYRERKKQRVSQLKLKLARVQQENVDLKDQLDVLNTTAGHATMGDSAMQKAAAGLDVVCVKKDATDSDFEKAIQTLSQTVGAHLARLGYHLEQAEYMLIPVKTYQVLLYIFTEERRPVTVDNRDPTLAHYLDELMNVTPEQIEGREQHREFVLERCAQLHASLDLFKRLRGTATSEIKEFYAGLKDMKDCFTVQERANFLRLVYNDPQIRKLLKSVNAMGNSSGPGSPRHSTMGASGSSGSSGSGSSSSSSSSSSSVAAAASVSGADSRQQTTPRFSVTAMERFKQSADKLQDYPSIARSCPGKFQWFVSDSTSTATGTNGTEAFVFDLTTPPGSLRQGTCRTPDAVLCLSELDFFRMMDSECNAQELFVSQRMEISGNIKMTLKLWHCVESLAEAPTIPKLLEPKV